MVENIIAIAGGMIPRIDHDLATVAFLRQSSRFFNRKKHLFLVLMNFTRNKSGNINQIILLLLNK